MVRLYTDPRMMEHVTPPRHPERPERLQAILKHLDRTGLSRRCEAGTVREATREELGRVHWPLHMDHVEAFDRAGGGLIEADTLRMMEGAIAVSDMTVGDVMIPRSQMVSLPRLRATSAAFSTSSAR